jgi:aminoglycoside phosphotransferase family enzyme
MMERAQIDILAEGCELVETHISWILLRGDEAFKIKKPLRFSFLDFSTMEKRGFYCHEEVRLNRRLAPDVYLGVVEIGEEGGKPAFARGSVIDHAVRMRRLDGSRRMDLLLGRGEVSAEETREIARMVARFHGGAEAVPGGYNSPEMIGAQIADLGGYRDTIEKASGFGKWVDSILARSAAFIKKERRLLEGRAKGGFVRDAHGDLHSGNVFFERGIKIIDCIEFSKDFRCIDVASDIAFMAMDLEYAGREDLSEEFVGEYSMRTGDPGLDTLLPFYKCYRANVRAQIAAIDWMQRRSEEARQRIDRYVLLAEKYAKTL